MVTTQVRPGWVGGGISLWSLRTIPRRAEAGLDMTLLMGPWNQAEAQELSTQRLSAGPLQGRGTRGRRRIPTWSQSPETARRLPGGSLHRAHSQEPPAEDTRVSILKERRKWNAFSLLAANGPLWWCAWFPPLSSSSTDLHRGHPSGITSGARGSGVALAECNRPAA